MAHSTQTNDIAITDKTHHQQCQQPDTVTDAIITRLSRHLMKLQSEARSTTTAITAYYSGMYFTKI